MQFPIPIPRKNSILGKLVLAFLAVMAPLIALGVIISERGADIVDKEISNSLQQQTRFYMLSLETEIERMSALQREFMNDEDLDALSMMAGRMSTYERLAAVKRLQARLRMIKESSVYIAASKAYIPAIERVVSSEGSVDELLQEDLNVVKSSSLSSSHPFIYENGDIYVREFFPSPYNLDVRNPNFILELKLSLPALYRFLEQLPGYASGGAVLISDNATVISGKHEASFEMIKQQLGGDPFRRLSDGAADAGTGVSERPAATKVVDLAEGNYLATSMYSSLLNLHLLVYVPEEEVMGPLEKYRTYLWIVLAAGIIVIPVFAYWIYRVIHQPLRKLVGAFRKVEAGMMQVEIQHGSNDEFRYLYEKFNYMVSHLNKLIYEVYEQKIRLQHSELKQLQSQINPHFLYNSFYLIYRMTKAYDNENAARFTRYLGDYYQYITRNGKEEVRLEDEVRHVRSFIEIQSIRFGDRISVSMDDTPPALKGLLVPRLILQPIVENAYHHGFSGDIEQCLLRISFRTERTRDGALAAVIEVADNGTGMTPEEHEQWRRKLDMKSREPEITGMLNVHSRLRLKFGEEAGIRLSSKGEGLTISLIIPLTEEDEPGGPGDNTDTGDKSHAERDDRGRRAACS